MVSKVVVSNDLLDQFNSWGDKQRGKLLVPYSSKDSAMSNLMEQQVEQGIIFRDDLKRHIHDLSIHSKYEIASIAQCISTIALSPFAILAEVCRLFNGSIKASTCLKNICVVPKHIILSIFKMAFSLVRSVNKVVSAVSVGIGFLAWHSGERLVRQLNGASHTVLPNKAEYRDLVYGSIGLTMVSAAAVFIPIAFIQLAALPIIIGSIYGTINNQFTVRECPEYYTMGHFYDGTKLVHHAIKTNNVLIKPVVTGCYATTLVTKFAGGILAAVGTLPYTAGVLPIQCARAMIGGVCLISLVAAHIFSNMKKNSIQKALNEYAALIGIEWNENNRNKRWNELAELRFENIEKKRNELALKNQELEKFDKKLQELSTKIESSILDPNLPVKYITGWNANNTRNSVGYLFAGTGTLVISVTTIFLRTLVF